MKNEASFRKTDGNEVSSNSVARLDLYHGRAAGRGAPSLPAEGRKTGGLGHYKNSFFLGVKKRDFVKVTKGAWILGGMRVFGQKRRF